MSGNAIASLDLIADVRAASLLSELRTTGNPLEMCMQVRLHTVHLLPQVRLSSPFHQRYPCDRRRE